MHFGFASVVHKSSEMGTHFSSSNGTADGISTIVVVSDSDGLSDVLVGGESDAEKLGICDGLLDGTG